MTVSGRIPLKVLNQQNTRMSGATLILLLCPIDDVADLLAGHPTMTPTVAMGVAATVVVAVVTIQEAVAVQAVVLDLQAAQVAVPAVVLDLQAAQVAQAAVAMALRGATTQLSVQTTSCLRLLTPVHLVGIHSTQVLIPVIYLATR
jgi:hypothetical protein